jgi:hypothetical protein
MSTIAPPMFRFALSGTEVLVPRTPLILQAYHELLVANHERLARWEPAEQRQSGSLQIDYVLRQQGVTVGDSKRFSETAAACPLSAIWRTSRAG